MAMSNNGATGASSTYVRAVNLASVLQQVIRQPGISRAGVAAAMGVTRSTVSRLVDDLVEGGFLMEGEPIVGARGRPATPLSPAAGTYVGVGLEINVNRAVGMVVDLTGAVLTERRVELDAVALGSEGSLAALANLRVELEADLAPGARVLGAHLAVPALVDRAEGTVLRAPNLGWENVKVGGMGVSNDIDCSVISLLESNAWAEDGDTFIYVSGEVGIGASVCIDGALRGGRHGWANELGHVTVWPDGALCGCGARGCLEAYAGLWAVLKQSGCASLDDYVAALEASDEKALLTLRSVGEALGVALSSALNLLDVSRVIFGGHLAVLHPWLEPIISDQMQERVLWSHLSEVELLPVGETPRHAAHGAAWSILLDAVADPAKWLA